MGREVGVDHLAAADRHETAALNHERAAKFWQDKGDAQRSGLQREMAEFERRGASLERRWAELVKGDGAETPRPPAKRAPKASGKRRPTPAERAADEARRTTQPLSGVLTRMADALDRTARLADDHAARREKAGRVDDAAFEREAAKRAREAAQRARSQAELWHEHNRGQET